MKYKLLGGIVVVLILLLCCMALDSADESIVINESTLAENVPNGALIVNNSSVVAVNDKASVIVGKSNDVVCYVHPVVGMYAKPSCGCKYKYTWHYREFVNYCPNCHHYGTLRKNPKGVHEREYTCHRCSSDFCGVCGKEKMGYSRVYLRRAQKC